MNEDHLLLTEKDAMWAEMLMQALKNNDVDCFSLPVYGAGLTLKTGMSERLKIYVPAKELAKAEALMLELFPGEE